MTHVLTNNNWDHLFCRCLLSHCDWNQPHFNHQETIILRSGLRRAQPLCQHDHLFKQMKTNTFSITRLLVLATILALCGATNDNKKSEGPGWMTGGESCLSLTFQDFEQEEG